MDACCVPAWPEEWHWRDSLGLGAQRALAQCSQDVLCAGAVVLNPCTVNMAVTWVTSQPLITRDKMVYFSSEQALVTL